MEASLLILKGRRNADVLWPARGSGLAGGAKKRSQRLRGRDEETKRGGPFGGLL